MHIKQLEALKIHTLQHFKQFDMFTFGEVDECGTVACLAGNCLITHGYKTKKRDDVSNDLIFLHPETGEKVAPDSEAATLLDLTVEQ